MIIFTENQKQIPGELLGTAILRSDAAPIPLTLEASIKAGNADVERQIVEGKILTLGNGDTLRVIKSEKVKSRMTQADREVATIQIVALLDSVHPAAFVRQRAIIKENYSLAAIYRACGGNVRLIDADFSATRFYCPVGDTPTFHIARILQEEGGIMRWKNKRLQFIRLQNLMDARPEIALPSGATMDIESGFLERHVVPWFFSVDASGAVIFGNRDKARAVRFAPHKNEQRLRNMTRCLLQRKTAKIGLNMKLCAGDIVDIPGDGRFAIITAAHVFDTGQDSAGQTDTYTRLWLGEVDG